MPKRVSHKYKFNSLPGEFTFVMIKPDGVMRGLIGDVVKRIEQRGLKIVAMKMVWTTPEQIDAFYPKNPEWVTRLGEKTLRTFNEYKLDAAKEMGSNDPEVLGTQVRSFITEYMTMGPVIPMVVEGLHAIAVIRKLAGDTLPVFAQPGTIRGDYSHDAPTSANLEGRGIFNIIHASETPEEAAHEIKHWFKPEEIFAYDRADHVIMFGDKRHL